MVNGGGVSLSRYKKKKDSHGRQTITREDVLDNHAVCHLLSKLDKALSKN